MQDTFARATHSAYAASRPSAARDDRVSCIQSWGMRRATKHCRVNAYIQNTLSSAFKILRSKFFKLPWAHIEKSRNSSVE